MLSILSLLILLKRSKQCLFSIQILLYINYLEYLCKRNF
nr:MAG TPA: hypothetical protein [Caudoviricetes sp.]